MQELITLVSDAIRGREKNFTTGSINRAIVLLSIPMVLEMAMESLFAVVDVFFVSKIGTDAVATVGLTESVLTLIYSLAMGLGMAATAMVARRIGEERPDAAARAGMQAMLLGGGISVLISVAGIWFAADILRLMGGGEALIAAGVGYTRLMLGSNAVIILLFLLNGIFRGAGDAALAMRSLWVANGINIVLDPLLIFGLGPIPAMGLDGAALATVIGRGAGVAYQLYHLWRGAGHLRLADAGLSVDWPIIRRLANVAATGAGQFLIASASWIFLMRIIALFGSEAVAGYTIAIRLLIFSILPGMGLANAAATLVGQNLGAGLPERAEASVWRSAFYNMVFLFGVSVIYFAAAPQIVDLFGPTPAVREAGVITLRIICVGYVFFAYGMVLGQAFNGAGDTRTPTLLNFICFWLMEIPLGYFLAVYLGLGLPGVCWAVAASETMLAILCILIFRRGHWKTVEI